MGQQLVNYYKQAEEIGGILAKMKLAMYTLIPSTQAFTAPDTPENIHKFQISIEKVKRELGEKRRTP